VHEPEYVIKIGIKNNKVVHVDWSMMFIKEPFTTSKEVVEKVQGYLKEALGFIDSE
jgi:hypothetical protein